MCEIDYSKLHLWLLLLRNRERKLLCKVMVLKVSATKQQRMSMRIDEPYDNDGDIAHCSIGWNMLCMVHSQMNSAALARQRPPQPRYRRAPQQRCLRWLACDQHVSLRHLDLGTQSVFGTWTPSTMIIYPWIVPRALGCAYWTKTWEWWPFWYTWDLKCPKRCFYGHFDGKMPITMLFWGLELPVQWSAIQE